MLIAALVMPMIALFVSFLVSLFVSFFMFTTIFLSMMLLIIRHVSFIVPPVLYEIDRAATGIVFGAVLTPMLFMTGRYMHINRLIYDSGGHRLNYDGFCINEFGLRRVSDVNAAIETGLTDADRNSNISCVTYPPKTGPVFMLGYGHKTGP
jgi:hypothetical protein